MYREVVPLLGRFTSRPNEGLICRLDDLRWRLEDPDVRVVNVLWRDWYTGEPNPFPNKRVRPIPGSVNLPIEEFMVDEEESVLPASELRAALERAGLSPEKEAVVHCHAAVRTASSQVRRRRL